MGDQFWVRWWMELTLRENRMASEQPTLSIIIPAYNEEKAVGVVLRDLVEMLAATDMAYEIIVVDDGSTDQTAPVAESSGARVVRHSRNRGYGAALKSGIRAARYERIVICDADGTYPINRVPEMMAKLESADMIVGARVGQNVNIPIMRRPGKWLLRRLAEYITGQPIDDLNSGLRAFRRSLVIQ